MIYDMITDFTPIFLVSIIAFALGRYIGYNVCKAFTS
jgi:putative Mn2+ efflux pump MntP